MKSSLSREILLPSTSNVNEPFLSRFLTISSGSVLAKISNRLGGVHYDQVDNLIKNAFEKNDKQTHYDWIEKLLLNYYDKMYDYQIEQKKDRCLQSGDWSEIFEFLSNYN